MFSNLAAAFLSLTMAVVPASSTAPQNHPKVQIDAINKMEEYAPLEGAPLQQTEVKVDELKKVPEVVAAPADLDSLFTKYAQQYGVDVGLLKRIAKCESGFNAGSNSGTYGGMFQYLASTWSSTRSTMGLDPNPDLRFNAEESIKTSAFKIANGGASSWPECSK